MRSMNANANADGKSCQPLGTARARRQKYICKSNLLHIVVSFGGSRSSRTDLTVATSASYADESLFNKPVDLLNEDGVAVLVFLLCFVYTDLLDLAFCGHGLEHEFLQIPTCKHRRSVCAVLIL